MLVGCVTLSHRHILYILSLSGAMRLSLDHPTMQFNMFSVSYKAAVQGIPVHSNGSYTRGFIENSFTH